MLDINEHLHKLRKLTRMKFNINLNKIKTDFENSFSKLINNFVFAQGIEKALNQVNDDLRIDKKYLKIIVKFQIIGSN